MTASEYLTTGDQATITTTGQIVTLGLFPTSSNHRHNCGDPLCRRFDIQGETWTAWGCQLSPVEVVTTVKVARTTYRIERTLPCDWARCADDCTGHAVAYNTTTGVGPILLIAATDGSYRRIGKPTTRRPRRVLTPIVKHMRTTLRVTAPGTPYRQECWSATSKDGVWRYIREDEPTTPWYVKHVATGVVIADTWGTLDNAREATADGSALATVEAQLAEQAGEVVAEAETIAAAAAPAPAATTGRPVATGHYEDMSESQATAIRLAGVGGHIVRGAATVAGVATGQLTDPQIRAAQKRGWVVAVTKAVGRRVIITGATVTTQGAERAQQITEASHTAA